MTKDEERTLAELKRWEKDNPTDPKEKPPKFFKESLSGTFVTDKDGNQTVLK